MKLIADEGVDQPIVAALRAAAFDVTYYAELAPGTDDASILAHAQSEQTLLLTCDKDFGELVYRNHLVSAGVVLIRLEGLSADKKARLVSEAIRLHGHQMLNAFAVVSPGMVRIRRSDVV
jgi:predicted nuclease of predicted toxin-antitoxin system